MAQVSGFTPLLYNFLDFRHGKGAGFSEGVARPCNLELHVTGADGVWIERGTTLSTGMRQLGDDKGAVGFGCIGDFFEGCDAAIVV